MIADKWCRVIEGHLSPKSRPHCTLVVADSPALPKDFCATAASVSDRAPPFRGAKPLVLTPSRSCFPLHLVSSRGRAIGSLSVFLHKVSMGGRSVKA